MGFGNTFTLAVDSSLMVKRNTIKVSSQVRVARDRETRDGLDHLYPLHSAGRDKVRKTNMQTDRANRVQGVF